MRFYADFHIHSHYSRATSKDLDLDHLFLWGQRKGIQVVGTGDFVHPGWMNELKEGLVPAEAGFFSLKPEKIKTLQNEVPGACQQPIRFMLTVEISSIYKRLGKVRKVHNIVCVPSFEAAEKIQTRLGKIGNIRSDGRPILGLDSHDLLEIVLDSDPLSYLIPAHIWTPWFAMLGSKSGFDCVQDCFGDLTPHIFALETGLSSDPLMNWRLSQLDPYVMVSNSDAHSPGKLGREANIFETDFSYLGIYNALKDPNNPGFKGTLEFFPEEGKYHLDGHRKCQSRLHPRETIHYQGLCPVCQKPVTVGVMARIEELADRSEGAKAPRSKPFHSLIPLPEILGEVLQVGPQSKQVLQEYETLLHQLGNEFRILFEVPLEEIRRVGGDLLEEGLRRMREGKVKIAPGYDGEYGTIQLFSPIERAKVQKKTQSSLFEDMAEEEEPEEEPEPLNEKEPESLPETTGKGNQEKTDPRIPCISPQTQHIFASRSDLNNAQREAVHLSDSHLLIIAGPGTGKTHTLVQRILQMALRLKDSERILAITFTNKAAEEMKTRLIHYFPEIMPKIQLGTFHQFCLQILRQYADQIGYKNDFRIASEDDILAVARIAWPDQKKNEISKNLETLEKQKNTLSTDFSPELQVYEKHLHTSGFLDFADLLRETVRLLRSSPEIQGQIQGVFRFLFIDEYQDINEVQQELLRLLNGPNTSITAIGDPNQSIYGFRGSQVQLFHQFSKTFPQARILYLQENYRTPGNLLNACTQVIQKENAPEVPPLVPCLLHSGHLTLFSGASELSEAIYVAHEIEKLIGGSGFFTKDSGRLREEAVQEFGFGDIAIFYRLNLQRKILEETLEKGGIPYQVFGNKSFQKTLLPQDEADYFERHAEKVSLMTLHASKGLEFPVVFILGCENTLIPLNLKGYSADPAEERRLFYVGMTRAKSRLYLTSAKQRCIFGKGYQNEPSPFLADIAEELKHYERSRSFKSKKEENLKQLDLFDF